LELFASYDKLNAVEMLLDSLLSESNTDTDNTSQPSTTFQWHGSVKITPRVVQVVQYVSYEFI